MPITRLFASLVNGRMSHRQKEHREKSTSTFASSAEDTLHDSSRVVSHTGEKEDVPNTVAPFATAVPPHDGILDSDAVPRGGDDPMAGAVEGGVQYQSMAWWQAGMVMVAEIISLGILALPKTMATLGLIPGLIILIFLGIMSTYSGYVIGQLKLAYPHVHSMAEAGEILFGPVGRELFGVAQSLFYIFVMGSHILTFSLAMNAITDHAACTVTFMFVGLILSLLCTLPRTLKNLSYYSIASFISIIAAVMVTMIAVSITKPGFQPDMQTGELTRRMNLWPQEDLVFYEAFLAVCNMVFAYAGNVAFFSFISELRNPNEFPKALAFLQTSDILMYIIASVVIYYYAGNTVASPALDSTSHTVRKVAYGVALPTVIIAGVVNGHVGVKYVYVRMFRNSKDDVMHQKSFKAIGSWIAICTVLWVTAWLIAEVVPVFSDLLGVTSALFASWFTYGLSGFFWIHLNFEKGDKWYKPRSKHPWTTKKFVLLVLNIINIFIGAIVCVVGLYAVSKSIQANAVHNRPFSCADNSRA